MSAANKALVAAAKARATVTLLDGRTGVIVYAPPANPNPRKTVRCRHGDPTMCGVRFPNEHRDTIRPVAVADIIGIVT